MNTSLAVPKAMELVRCNDAAVSRKARVRCGTASSASRPPTIVLSPSSPDSGSQSFDSSYSDSEFPSAPASTISDDRTSVSFDSIPASVDDDLRKTYQRALSRLKNIRRNEVPNVATLPLSDAHFKLVRQFCVQVRVISNVIPCQLD